MSKQIRGVRQLRVNELPAWLFRCGYREDWRHEPAAWDWDDQATAWLREHAPHFLADGRDGRTREFFDERNRRRWGRLPRDPEGYRHPDGRDGYGRSLDEVLLPTGTPRLPADPNPPQPPTVHLPDPRRLLDPKLPEEERAAIAECWRRLRDREAP